MINKDEKNKKLVSIIMPAYNCEDFIAEAISSVLVQSYKNWELIIINDNSSDGTEKIITEFVRNDHRITTHKLKKNSGAALARNKGTKEAKGDFIAFLDSDDIWSPKKLSKQIQYMLSHNYNFTCTNYSKINEESITLNKIVLASNKSNYNDLLKTCPGNSTVIYNSEKLGKFTIPNIRKRNDYVLWLKIIKKSQYIYGMNESLGSHRVRSGSLSKNKFSLVIYHWRIYRDLEKLSIFRSLYLVNYWSIVTFFKLR